MQPKIFCVVPRVERDHTRWRHTHPYLHVSITSGLLADERQEAEVGRAKLLIYPVCETRGDNKSCHCQATTALVGYRITWHAASEPDCRSLSTTSAATPQLPVSKVCKVRLHPAEVSNEAASPAAMLHSHIGVGMQAIRKLSQHLDHHV